jgi:RNA polymerase sigma factor for flagellar operon FliA
MSERHELEALFLANLAAIERIIAALCRRHGLAREDADEFASWSKAKLIEADYLVLRKFRGESALTTYLTVVLASLFRDYRVRRWGRWRPSAEAQRRGALAIRLEALVYRSRLSLHQAAQVLRTAGETTLADRELSSLLAELPSRTALRPLEVRSDLLSDTPARGRADDLVRDQEAAAEREAVEAALSTALARLPPEDRAMVRMHYWEGMSVADIARALDLPQKPLYRRLEKALAALRAHLHSAGVTRAWCLVGENESASIQ